MNDVKIAEYTRTELDYLEVVCNFTPEEQQLLQLRSRGIQQEECAEQMSMSISTIKRLEQKIQSKIEREF